MAYLDMAIRFSQTSDAVRRKVGALIVGKNGVISEGVNGQPEGWHTEVCEGEDGTTLPTVIHAEDNALRKLQKKTVSSVGADLYISDSPCLDCAIKISGAGIKSVFYKNSYRLTDGIDYLKNKGIEVQQIDVNYEHGFKRELL